MDRRVRYEVLRDEDSDGEQEQATSAPAPVIPMAMVVIPVEETADTAVETNQPAQAEATPGTEPDPDAAKKFFVPPSYDVATELPSYEEAERTKLEEEERRQEEASTDTNNANPEAGCLQQSNSSNPDPQLGTDGMFLCTFMISFVFNWIGLLASLCLTQSVAGRLGAMSGFGLSLVKWVAIVKHNNWIHGVADADSWLWWLLIILGFLIFFRGCTQYIRIKYQWNRLTQHVRNNIFYYF